MCRWWLLSTACFALPHLHAPCGGNLMWWQPNVMALTPLTMETMTGGQGCTSASSIYHPDDFFFFFFCNPFPFFSSKRDKVRTRTHYALGWCEPLVKYRKIKVLSAWGETQSLLSPISIAHPLCTYSEQLNKTQFISNSFWHTRVCFFLTFVNRDTL